jgi:methanogenic corrinoid protein MtbC1
VESPTGVAAATLSIGALSRSTGVSTETLRTWERRYGFPNPIRRPSGHRIYPLASVPRLRRIVQALAQGHRPADVFALDGEALESLIEDAGAGPLLQAPGPAPRQAAPRGRRATVARGSLRALVAAARRLDEPALQSQLEAAAARLDAVSFVEQVARPLMTKIGKEWVAKRLDVRHEHFASARLADVLRQMRRRFTPMPTNPRAVIAALPGDSHELGLLMAAVVFGAAGWQVIYMGRETPVDQLLALAGEIEIECVALGVSPTAPVDATRRAIATLRRSLPGHVAVLVGGSGAKDSDGVVRIDSTRSLRAWIDARANPDVRR